MIKIRKHLRVKEKLNIYFLHEGNIVTLAEYGGYNIIIPMPYAAKRCFRSCKNWLKRHKCPERTDDGDIMYYIMHCPKSVDTTSFCYWTMDCKYFVKHFEEVKHD